MKAAYTSLLLRDKFNTSREKRNHIVDGSKYYFTPHITRLYPHTALLGIKESIAFL